MNKQSFMWLTISSKIFVDFLGDAKLLLYDTVMVILCIPVIRSYMI